MMIWLDVILLIAAFYVELTARAVRLVYLAPQGYEDERGFHYGDEP